MSEGTNKWLVGCGIGCGVLILIVITVGVGGFFVAKRTIGKFEQTAEVMEVVTDRYGEASDFRPDPDGGIRPARMEAFLEVCDRMVPVRREMEGSLAMLSEAESGSGSRSFSPARGFRLVKAGLGLIPQIAQYYASRNNALLSAGIGPGEYYFIYALSYYSWLGKSPADGPSFRLVGKSGEHEDGWDEFDVREHRLETIRGNLNRLLLSMLRHQLEDLQQQETVGERSAWQKELTAEIDRMAADPYRLPWSESLPQPLEASLSPYRDRLEAAYSELCNPLEVSLSQDGDCAG